MDKSFHSTLYWAYDYLDMLRLKLIHVSKRRPMSLHYRLVWEFTGDPWPRKGTSNAKSLYLPRRHMQVLGVVMFVNCSFNSEIKVLPYVLIYVENSLNEILGINLFVLKRLYDKQTNTTTVAIDDLAPCIARSSATKVSSIHGKEVLGFHEEIATPSCCW